MNPDFRKEVWKIVSTIRINSKCPYLKSLKKCKHPENIKKKCSYENCPIATRKICTVNKCLFSNRPFSEETKVVV